MEVNSLNRDEIFLIDLLSIQPTQLYINAAKVNKVRQFYNPISIQTLPPIPIAKLEDKIIFTDGHTRAFVAYQAGLKKIRVYWDSEDLDWEVYRVCLDWCITEGIKSIKDLENRVVHSKEYKKLWIARCKVAREGIKKNGLLAEENFK